MVVKSYRVDTLKTFNLYWISNYIPRPSLTKNFIALLSLLMIKQVHTNWTVWTSSNSTHIFTMLSNITYVCSHNGVVDSVLYCNNTHWIIGNDGYRIKVFPVLFWMDDVDNGRRRRTATFVRHEQFQYRPSCASVLHVHFRPPRAKFSRSVVRFRSSGGRPTWKIVRLGPPSEASLTNLSSRKNTFR